MKGRKEMGEGMRGSEREEGDGERGWEEVRGREEMERGDGRK